MEISNQYQWASSYYSSSTSTATASSGSSAFADLISATMSQSIQSSQSTSLAQEMAAAGAESLGQAPDFASMSLEEFQEHLCELQSALAASGVDTSSMTNPEDLTTEELESLQEEMSSRGKNPPPPPMESMNLNFVDYSNLSTSMLETLFDYM